MLPSFIVRIVRIRRLAMLVALCLPLAGEAVLATPMAPPAPPVPSTGAPHPSAPVVKVAGMTLEIRSGRAVVTEVAKDSPADRAGVRPLDVLLVVNDRSLVDLDPITPQQVLGLLPNEPTLRTRLVLGRGTGTLSVDLPQDLGGTWALPVVPVNPRPGAQAPLFTGRDLHGREFALKDHLGNPVLLDFWASTCPPCVRAAIPLRRIAERYEGKLVIVGISLDEDRKAFEAFVYNQHLPGAQLFDGAGWRGPVVRLYEVPANGIPYYVLLDAGGRIAALGDLGSVERAIEKLTPTTR
jgi:thiol-disulfide isomerase/thioredoxin